MRPNTVYYVMVGYRDFYEKTPGRHKPYHHDWCHGDACQKYWDGFYAAAHDACRNAMQHTQCSRIRKEES